jgi:hypothetical protein
MKRRQFMALAGAAVAYPLAAVPSKLLFTADDVIE